jgi:hypothetical protein
MDKLAALASERSARNLLRNDHSNRQLAEHGFMVVPFLEQSQVEELRKHTRKLVPADERQFKPSLVQDDPELRREVFAAIEQVSRSWRSTMFHDAKICIANFLVKEPEAPDSRVPMHVDWSFVDEREFASINVWCPLVDVDEANGCLQVVAGSQHHDVLLRPDTGAARGAHPYHDVLGLLTRDYLQGVPMPAGHAIVYHGRLLHGSGPNSSRDRRIALGFAAAPVEAPILHSFLVSPNEVETFEVSTDFFCTSRLGQRPEGVRSLGTVPYSVAQLNEDEIRCSRHLRPWQRDHAPVGHATT